MDAETQSRETERERETIEAKERQIFDLVNKVFDFSLKRVTDMKENSKIYFPKPQKANKEGELEMVREVLMGEFRIYKREKEDEFEKKRETKEWANISIGRKIDEKGKNEKRKEWKKEKIEQRENTKMDGFNDANDTSGFVEAERK